MAKAKKKKTHGVAWWKKKVWKEAFSPYIRLRDALETTGNQHTLLCCSCGKPYKAFGLGCAQAGHFVPGRKNSILFHEKCVHGQCYNCNITLKGNWPGYFKFMTEKYGEDVIWDLIALSYTIVKFTVEELEAKHIYYLEQIEMLKSKPKPDIMARKKIGNNAGERTVV